MALNQVDISMMQDIPAPGPAGKIIISDGADWTSGENAPVGAIVKQATDPTPTDPATPSVGDMILNNITGQLFSCTTETPSAAVWTVIGVVEVDLSPVKNDISLLALQNAINGNLSAYGLKNSWIEQFENSNYIENLTTTYRDDTGEFIASGTATVTAWPYTSFASQTMTEWGSPTMQDHPHGSDYLTMQTHGVNSISGAQNAIGWWASPSGYTCGLAIDYLASYTWNKFSISNYATYGIVEDLRQNILTKLLHHLGLLLI